MAWAGWRWAGWREQLGRSNGVRVRLFAIDQLPDDAQNLSAGHSSAADAIVDRLAIR
jgi:hypothetical protein